jgi:hypothetical protein
MVKISVLNDCLKSMYNAEKRGKRQVRRSPCELRSETRREGHRRTRALGGTAFLSSPVGGPRATQAVRLHAWMAAWLPELTGRPRAACGGVKRSVHP